MSKITGMFFCAEVFMGLVSQLPYFAKHPIQYYCLIGFALIAFLITLTLFILEKYGYRLINPFQRINSNSENKEESLIKYFVDSMTKALSPPRNLTEKLTDSDIERMAQGLYNQKTQTFSFKRYAIPLLTLDKDFSKQCQKYNQILLHRIPCTAESVIISFKIAESFVGNMPTLDSDYKIKFFIKCGNGKELVDEKSNKFCLLKNKHFGECDAGAMGGKYEVLQFQFYAEVDDKSILFDSKHFENGGLALFPYEPQQPLHLEVVIESFSI